MIETITVIVSVSDCFFLMTYWSNFIISTGHVKDIHNIPAIQPITFIWITFQSLIDQQISTFMVVDSFVVLALFILQLSSIDHFIYLYFSDLFSRQIFGFAVTLAHLVYLSICTSGPLWLSFLLSVGLELVTENIALIDSGFLNYLTHLVYLIIVLNGLCGCQSSVCSITFL